MSEGRVGSGRLPDERFHTDNVFNSISAFVPASSAVTDLWTHERTTGADALLFLVTPNATLRYAIQAKNVVSHVQADVSRDADPPHYPRLDYRTADGHQQYDLLLSACAQGGTLAGRAVRSSQTRSVTAPSFVLDGDEVLGQSDINEAHHRGVAIGSGLVTYLGSHLRRFDPTGGERFVANCYGGTAFEYSAVFSRSGFPHSLVGIKARL